MSDQTPQHNSATPSLPRGLLSRRGKLTPNARLPSLRPQRDLTLGGVQKKTFKPNIPSRKERSNLEPSNEGGSESSSRGQSAKKDHHRKNKERPHGRDRVRPEALQSHSSIFEEGPADALRRKWGGGGGGGGGGTGGGAGASQRRVVKKERDAESDARMMQELMRDDFIDELGEKTEKSAYSPIQLPLKSKKRTVKKEVKEEEEDEPQQMDVDIVIKEEKNDDDEFDAMEGIETVSPKPAPKIKQSSTADKPKFEITAGSLFSNTKQLEGELLFFQLPDSLPGNSESEISKVHVKKEGDAGKKQPEVQQNIQDNNCHLKHLPEGFIGKLQVLKSGRTRLLLGNVSLDVSMGAPCGFLQDLVSMHLNEDKTGNMNSLGQVRNRIVCSPDFESLLSLGT